MLKWIPVLLIVGALCFLTVPAKLSRNIDFSKLGAREKAYLEPFEGKIIHTGFNRAPEIGNLIQSLGKDFHIEAAVETGTWKGETTRFLSSCFDEVHTIEISDEHYKNAIETLKDRPNVHLHLGSSEKVMHEILPALSSKRTIFYLDAHWNEYWPLLDELEEIGKTHKDNCIVVIDDFKVPHRRDISYDKYGRHKCSYEYISKKLDQVFTDYDYYYLIPKDLTSRAKFVAIPKKWSKNQSSVCKAHFENPINFLRGAYR